MKVTVQCTLEVEIEWPDGPVPDGFDSLEDWLKFRIEENGCPGTGEVGSAIEDSIEYGESGVCWACNLKGSNKILSHT